MDNVMTPRSDSQGTREPLTLDDVVRLEEAAYALLRAVARGVDGSELRHGRALMALALKVRFSFGIPPWERAER